MSLSWFVGQRWVWCGTDGLVEWLFKVHRTCIAEGVVEPLPVVKDFQIVEDKGLSVTRIDRFLPVEALGLEGGIEAFHDRVVVGLAVRLMLATRPCAASSAR